MNQNIKPIIVYFLKRNATEFSIACLFIVFIALFPLISSGDYTEFQAHSHWFIEWFALIYVISPLSMILFFYKMLKILHYSNSCVFLRGNNLVFVDIFDRIIPISNIVEFSPDEKSEWYIQANLKNDQTFRYNLAMTKYKAPEAVTILNDFLKFPKPV